MITTPGFYSISADEYHADPCEIPSLSSGILETLLFRSPLHARQKHPRLNPAFVSEEKKCFDLGRAAHGIFLEDDEESLVVIDAPAYNRKMSDGRNSSDVRDEAYAAGKTPLLRAQYEEVRAMVDAGRAQLREFEGCEHVFDPAHGQAEQTMIWEEDGFFFRCRPDWLQDDLQAVYDLKTTGRTAEPHTWARTGLWPHNGVQAAFYLRGLRALGIASEATAFRFVAIETASPYAISIVEMTPAALDLAERQVSRAVDLWKRCLANDEWPGYPRQIFYADAPAWEAMRWEMRESMED
jgi:hypothetical protein